MIFIKIFFVFHVFLKMSFFPFLERNNCFSDKTPLIPSYCLGTSSAQRWAGLEDSSKGKNSVDSLKRQAFKTGDWVDIKALIDKHPDSINDTNVNGETLLQLSIQQEKWDVTKNLLEKGNINTNLENNNEEVPLLFLYQLRVKRISNKTFFQLLWYWISPSGRKDRKRIDTFIMKIQSKEGVMNLSKIDKQLEICNKLKGRLQRHLIKKIQNELISMRDKDNSSLANPVLSDTEEMTTKHKDETNYLHLENDSNPDVKDLHKNSSLHRAIKNGNFNMLKTLVEIENVDVNLSNAKGELPLHRAIITKNVEIVNYLLEHGADVNLKGADGRSSFRSAELSGREEIMKSLIRSVPDINNLSDGYWYNYIDNLDMLKYCIKYGANIHLENINKDTVLEKVIKYGSMDMLEYLIEEGANLNRRNKFGSTILHRAVEEESISMIKYFIQQGFDINAKNTLGKTPLHHAFRCIDRTIIHYLIKKKADLDSKDTENRTPLHIAYFRGSLSTVKDLVKKYNVDINKDKEGALYWATEGGHLSMVKYLIRHYVKNDPSYQVPRKMLDVAIKNRRLSLMHFFIETWKLNLNMNVNQVDDEGRTPLHLAIDSNRMDIIKYFINDLNIDINTIEKNTQDEYRESYLHFVYKKKNYDLLKYFLKQGARWDVLGISGSTVLDLARQENDKKALEILDPFIRQREEREQARQSMSTKAFEIADPFIRQRQQREQEGLPPMSMNDFRNNFSLHT